MTNKNLDPQIAEMLAARKHDDIAPMHALEPAKTREIWNPLMIQSGGPIEEVADIENRVIAGPAGELALRIYTPQGQPPFPVLVYFHGGGWVIGNLDTHDSVSRTLARHASCVVVSVDYRLAPEHKFPAAVDDAYWATQWVAEHASELKGDPDRIAVGGDSAGGTLAAVICLRTRDCRGPHPICQMLIYPVTNLASFDTRSYREQEDFYPLTIESMAYLRDHYLNEEKDYRNPWASPLLADDLSNLPPAIIVTAEFDVLTAECEDYAKRLKASGVQVVYRCYDGMIHGFFRYGALSGQARQAQLETAAELRRCFATHGH